MNAYKIAKYLMKKFETYPVSPEVEIGECNEVFHHRCFLNGSESARKEIMLKSSLSKYQNELENPWDRYLNVDLTPLLRGKVVLDLGCFTGGRTIAWFEKYDLKHIVGIDISQIYIDAAKQFSEMKKGNADFKLAKGEGLPFENDKFDAILSYDVFEHVQELGETLNECYRVLKKGGKLIVVFPGYFHPLEHHLDFVTKLPVIHYFFNGKILIRAYHEICEDRGDEAYWYKRNSDRLETWEKGNTLNGTTFRKFRELIKKNSWAIISHNKKPIGSLMRNRSKNIAFRLISYIGRPLVHVPLLEEIFTNRIVYILEKME